MDVEVDVDVDVELDLFDEVQAAMESAVAPVTAKTANRVSRGDCGLTDINVSPILVWHQRKGFTR
ncbi:hypothetical protein [Mycobacterium servetii]|uniref:Uncharacterized protein n=1 Tax=Mycobacterium servetii TaxID=3237418 RepID=A0ABV4C2J2_9MYCO